MQQVRSLGHAENFPVGNGPKAANASPKHGKGAMPFKFRFIKATIHGGPYMAKHPSLFGVKMAAEIDRACQVDIPTRDFDVPPVEIMKAGMRKAFTALLEEGEIYVGCMGGIGRTGLFMAAMAKAAGELDPVGYVREHYIPHAVETTPQQRYILRLDVSDLQHDWTNEAYRYLYGPFLGTLAAGFARFADRFAK
jgi:hypothetical protein